MRGLLLCSAAASVWSPSAVTAAASAACGMLYYVIRCAMLRSSGSALLPALCLCAEGHGSWVMGHGSRVMGLGSGLWVGEVGSLKNGRAVSSVQEGAAVS